MLKDTLWREIDALPESQLEALWDFVQFLQYTAQKKQTTKQIPQRIPGLDAGSTWISEDFDDPLPDAFWFSESEDNEATV